MLVTEETELSGVIPMTGFNLDHTPYRLGGTFWVQDPREDEPGAPVFNVELYIPDSTFWCRGEEDIATLLSRASFHDELTWLGSFCEREVTDFEALVQVNFTAGFYVGKTEGYEVDPHMAVSDDNTTWHVVDWSGNLLATLRPQSQFGPSQPPQVWALLYKLTFNHDTGFCEWQDDGPAYLVREFRTDGELTITVYKLIRGKDLRESEDDGEGIYLLTDEEQGWPSLDYCFIDAAVNWVREVVWDQPVPGVDRIPLTAAPGLTLVTGGCVPFFEGAEISNLDSSWDDDDDGYDDNYDEVAALALCWE